MSDADVKEHIDMFGGTPAVAVMADPKRSLFAAYVVKNGKSRTARVVVLEGVRPSNPDGVPVAHILFGRAQLPHEFGHHGVEEKKRGPLENGTEGGFGSGRLPAPRTDEENIVGIRREIAIPFRRHGVDVRPYPLRNLRRLHDGHRAPGVGDEYDEVALSDDGGGHIADEVVG